MIPFHATNPLVEAVASPFFGLAESTLVILAVVAILFNLFVFMGIWASRYTKVGPDQVLVISGRKYMVVGPDGKPREAGYRLVKGGGAFVWPVYEKADALSLKPFSVEFVQSNLSADKGGRIAIAGVVQLRILGDDLALARAVETLLGKTPEELKDVAAQVLEGTLRTLVGSQTVEATLRNESRLAQQLQEAAAPALANFGIGIISLSIREVSVPPQTKG